MYENPFYNRGIIRKVKDFYGRGNEIREIYQMLRNNQSCSLIGPRRIGRSSLLVHLARPTTLRKYGLESDDYYFIRINFEELDLVTKERFFEEMAEETIEEFSKGFSEDELRSLEGVNARGAFDRLRKIIKEIRRMELIRREKRPNLIYIFDEFDLACANENLSPNFYSQLRSLATPKYDVTYLLSTKRPLNELPFSRETFGSPFFNIFSIFPIGLFKQDEAVELISSPSEHTGVPLKDEVDFILELAGRHPLFIQILCWHLFELKAKKGGLNEKDRKAATYRFLRDVKPHLEYYWKDLGEEERGSLTERLKRRLLGGANE